MKNLLVLITLLFLSTSIFSQRVMIDKSRKEVINFLKYNEFDYEYNESGDFYIHHNEDVSFLIYLENDTCSLVVIVPNHDINEVIENYNNQFIVIDDNEWKDYDEGFIYHYYLLYNEEDEYYFIIIKKD